MTTAWTPVVDKAPGTRLRIGIATVGRFHVLDLARELEALGHEVRFYSYVPRKRAERFGLPRQCHVALLPLLAPLLVLQRFLPRRWRQSFDLLIYLAVNAAVKLRMQPCDVFICMSGVYLEAAIAARRRYDALIYLERGSRHILSQHEILAAISGADTPPAFAIRRELQGYQLADRIVVPSMHAEESFVERGIAHERLFRNPYGVNLEMFPLTPAATGIPPTVLFVGTWCLQKGCDELVAAVRRLPGVHLLHVGSIGDAPLPTDIPFEHVEPVPQWRLTEYYSRAHVFALASRQEGLALVLAQALASGLPIVCTPRTGGTDLRAMLRESAVVEVVPEGSDNAFADAIQRMLARSKAAPGSRIVLSATEREALSWQAYGQRYADRVLEDVLNKTSAQVLTP